MRTWIVVVAAVLLAVPVYAQRHKVNINAETPEGQLLQQIGQEGDEAKKIALMEQFVSKFPKNENLVWVLSQLIPAYTKAGQFDKAMDAGDKVLAIDAESSEDAHAALKAAEAKKDPDAVLKWAPLTSQAARKVVQSPKPKEESEEELWKARVDFSRQLDTYCEYSLYATALQTPDPRKKIELGDALEKLNPQSQYLPQVAPYRFLAYQQTGDKEKAVAIAEKVLEKDQTNEDMLLAAADYYLNKNDNAKVLAYSGKLVEVMSAKPKPEGVSDADWEKKKTLTLGLAHWMTGISYSNQSKWAETDKSMRQALPLVKGNEQLLAVAYFHLGLANFQMKNIVDAIKFNQACAAIKSPVQAQAQSNLKAIQREYRLVK